MMTPPSQLPDQGTVQPSEGSPQETIVIPPKGEASFESKSEQPSSPLTPGSFAPQDTPSPSGESPSIPINPWPKRILIISIILCLIVALVFGIKTFLSYLESNKQVTITYWGLWENDQIIAPLIEEFEAQNPKITVEYAKQSHKQYRERLDAAIVREDGPDVFRFHNTWVPMLYKNLSPVPTTIMTPSEFTNTFYPVAGSDLIAGQTIYGIPLMIEGLGLYYNEDLFAAAGVTSPPSTWEELLAIIPKIAKPEGSTFAVSAIALGTTSNIENFSDILANMFMQNGASLTNPVGAEAEETLSFYKRFANPIDPVYTWNDTMDNAFYAFAMGKVAMMLAPSWRAFDIKEINPSLRFKIAPIPQLPGNSVTWASYWVEGVSAQSKYQEQAWQFVKFLTSREAAVKLYSEASKVRLFGEPYARMDLASSVESDPYVGAYINQAKNSKSFPLASRTHDNGLNDKMIKYLENAVNALDQGSSPETELKTMAQGFKQVFSSYGLSTGTSATSQTQ